MADADNLSDSDELQIPGDMRCAMEALRRLFEGEYPIGITSGSIVGLDTAIVVLETTGGLVPLFAYLNADLRAVLRNQTSELAAPVDGAGAARVS